MITDKCKGCAYWESLENKPGCGFLGPCGGPYDKYFVDKVTSAIPVTWPESIKWKDSPDDPVVNRDETVIISNRFVVCAAIRSKLDGLIICSPRHFDRTMHQILDHCNLTRTDWEQGFVDQFGMFMNREDALKVATNAGQVNVRGPKTGPEYKLFSEDLY